MYQHAQKKKALQLHIFLRDREHLLRLPKAATTRTAPPPPPHPTAASPDRRGEEHRCSSLQPSRNPRLCHIYANCGKKIQCTVVSSHGRDRARLRLARAESLSQGQGTMAIGTAQRCRLPPPPEKGKLSIL